MSAPSYVMLLRSTNVQIYPAISHVCRNARRRTVSGANEIAWLEQLSDVLCWSCPHCEFSYFTSVSALSNNNNRRYARLVNYDVDADVDDDDDGALINRRPVLMGLNEWLRRTKHLMTREEFCRVVKESQ